MSLSSEDPQ